MKYIIISILSLFIFTSCANKNISIEKKNEKINHLHGSIKLKDGTVLAYNKIFYMLVVKNSISNEDFISLKNDLNGIGNLTYKKFERTKKSFNKKEVVLSYSLSKDDIKKINKIVSRYDNVIKNKTLYAQVSGYQRVYPRTDLLSPFIGYIFKTDSSRKGRKGIERYYNKQLENNKDIILNMNLNNLVNLEREVDKLKKNLNAYEVSSIVLDLDSGYVDSIASSNRYNPMAIKANKIPYLNISLIESKFNIDFLYEPIKSVSKDNVLDNIKNFGLLSKSNIDMSFEKAPFPIKNDNNENFSVNLIQILKAYSIFYNDGVLKDFKLAKQDSISQKQIIPKDLANEVKNNLEIFYKSIENKKVLVKGRTSTIKFKYFQKDNKRYLKAYLIIENNDMKYYRCLINFENKPITSSNFFQMSDKVSIIHSDYNFIKNKPQNMYFEKEGIVYYHQQCKEAILE